MIELIREDWEFCSPVEIGCGYVLTIAPVSAPAARLPNMINMSYEVDALAGVFDRMRSLQDGWNGYSAPAPSGKAIDTARGFLSPLLRGKREPQRVAPSAVGGVGITHKNQGRRVYVEFFNDGRVYALFSDGETEPHSVRITPDHREFRKLIEQIREYLDG